MSEACVGLLAPGVAVAPLFGALVEALATHGYVQGENLRVAWR